ncbi:MAG TPA: outer membrane beta-barrel protein [Cyclobacteriaceae bacterium]
MERQKFEESFRKSFGNAEVPPSEKVWMNIELDLERLERGRMRKRLTFFKLLAAASVVFGLGLAGTGLYLLSANRSTTDGLVAQQNDTASPGGGAKILEGSDVQGPSAVKKGKEATENKQTPMASTDSAPESRASRTESQPQLQADNITRSQNAAASGDHATTFDFSAPRDQIVQPVAQTGQAVSPVELASGKQDDISIVHNRPLPPLVKQRKIEPHFPKTEPDAMDLLLASVEMEERAEAERKKYDGERIWTSVGFSAGTFSNYGAGTLQSPSLMGMTSNLTPVNNTLTSESRASGVAYSVGVSVGGRIAPRWVLQGGVNYMMQNASFMSDAVVTQDYQNFTAAYSAEITKMADASARVVPTAPYSVNNNMEYLSIPIQAGYLIVNRAFGVQLTGGVATDLFIRNTLQPQSGNLDKVTNGSGSDSPYRTVNFSGLVGTEFSYRFSEKYRISLNPGLRYPFSSIYKSDVGLSATPVTFDVGLRFRYIFN